MADEFYTAEELLALPYGTTVRVVVPYAQFEKGDIIYKSKSNMPHLNDLHSCYFTKEYEDPTGEGTSGGDWMTYEEVAKVAPNACVETPLPEAPAAPEDLGVYRPELTDRKVGKVRVELVDDGFPLALREIAKVMTWAQTAKGYKDHDWQNLPNAEQALAAAASRHRTDHIKQRIVDGENIVDCVDGESKLLHKAHEAFGVLAQLELMLRGEFDK